MTDPHTHAMELWNNYKNAKTPEDKARALFELQEFARTNKNIPKQTDPFAQDIATQFGGEIQ